DETEKTEKIIYKTEDQIKTEGMNFNHLMIHNGSDTGIYLEYESTGPNPDQVRHRGSTETGPYYLAVASRKFIRDGQSLHSTQYLTVGDQKRTEANIEKYRGVSLYPFPNGMIPFILVSELSGLGSMNDASFDKVLRFHEKLALAGFEGYIEAVSLNDTQIDVDRMNSLLKSGAEIALLGTWDPYANPETQVQAISALRQSSQDFYNLDLRGIRSSAGSYSLSTIKALQELGLLFDLSSSVDQGVREGIRQPEFASYKANQTLTVMFPVSQPFDRLLSIGWTKEDVFDGWVTAITDASERDEYLMFQWDSLRMSDEAFREDVEELINYSIQKGLSSASPEKIASHMQSLTKVHFTMKSVEGATLINVTNENPISIKGITLKVVMPTIEEKCNYRVVRGTVERTKKMGSDCIVYVSTALEPGQSRELVVESNMTKKLFFVNLPDKPLEGVVDISVTDEDGQAVTNADISIDGKIFRTNAKGIVQVNLAEGTHVIEVNKPGFTSQKEAIEVGWSVKQLIETEKIRRPATIVLAFIFFLGAFAFFIRRKRTRKRRELPEVKIGEKIKKSTKEETDFMKTHQEEKDFWKTPQEETEKRTVRAIDKKIERAVEGIGKNLQSGQDAMKRKDVLKAIESFQKVLQKDPRNISAYSNLGIIYFQNRDFAQAIEYFSVTTTLDEKNPKNYFNLGYSYYSLGEVEKAIANYRKATEIDPYYARAYFELGTAWTLKHDLKEAASNFKKAIELDPKYTRMKPKKI
ncbi:MAG: tetratricopeptide repeat protein, partial [Candidatus Altiarchaeota archaeon]